MVLTKTKKNFVQLRKKLHIGMKNGMQKSASQNEKVIAKIIKIRIINKIKLNIWRVFYHKFSFKLEKIEAIHFKGAFIIA